MAKTYDTYKDSGIAWIGEIPGEWEVKKLKFSCKLYGRIGFRGYTADDLVDEGEGAITLSPTNFDGMKLNYSHCSFLNWDKYEESPEIKVYNGDVVLVKTASVGKCAYVSNLPLECTVNPQILVLKEHKDYSKFIAYLFNTKLGEAYIDTTKGGSTIYTISQEKIGNYTFPFPPLSVQQSISSFLDTKCGEIDSLISIQEEMISELLAYKQSVITEAVTKGLDKKAKMKNSGVEWIGDIPEEWVKDKIFRVFSVIGSGTTPKATDDRNFEGDINWIQSGDINGGKMFECKNKISENVLNQYSTLKIYKAPFIIVAMYGASVGNISISNIDGCVNQACCVMSNSNQCFNYLFYAIKAAKDYLIYRAEGGGQPNISQDKLKNLWLPLPPLPVQQAIATYLDEKTSQIDSLIALKQSKIESLKEYKKSIIYEYVTGKKRV